ncbi:migration and invasion-inhibitory protein-like [Anneissia japonica]|uniref:migration and invasion-inhibitory protein-like n=1 Tax=Anneissia japonica TaxID=1529436 RepID=UPI00142573F2|nr:migration and invasion-inhibitory protein-like [Anneissia japonica]
MHRRLTTKHDTTLDQSHLDRSGRVQPLLGYDWIAGLLDAEDTISERSDAFFDELKDFRRVNKEDCVYRQTDESLNKSSTMITGLPRSTITHPTDTHQCLHNFTLNNRLFVVPVHSNQEGESTCPICHESRTAQVRRGSPSYIRVSIPRSTLRSPYKLRPHRRRSFDATDALGLSQHCLAGWENSRPSMLPMATNIDLKDALRPQILKEGTVGNESLYKSSKRLPLVASERTQRLLNRSHSLRVQLNRMKNKHA